MKMSNKNKLNLVLIPKNICHMFKLHRWFYTSRNHALMSQTCVRCGMRGNEYSKRIKT